MLEYCNRLHAHSNRLQAEAIRIFIKQKLCFEWKSFMNLFKDMQSFIEVYIKHYTPENELRSLTFLLTQFKDHFRISFIFKMVLKFVNIHKHEKFQDQNRILALHDIQLSYNIDKNQQSKFECD